MSSRPNEVRGGISPATAELYSIKQLTINRKLFFPSYKSVILGFETPGKRASVLVFSGERAEAPGHEVGGTKGAQSKDLVSVFSSSRPQPIILNSEF